VFDGPQAFLVAALPCVDTWKGCAWCLLLGPCMCEAMHAAVAEQLAVVDLHLTFGSCGWSLPAHASVAMFADLAQVMYFVLLVSSSNRLSPPDHVSSQQRCNSATGQYMRLILEGTILAWPD
jgi:hypothetical protein